MGGAGQDVLDGGTNDDTLIDHAGEDSLYGADGNDVLDAFDDDFVDRVLPGPGSDDVIADAGEVF
jgi:Ca2+-binding RTX toxin-like protein